MRSAIFIASLLLSAAGSGLQAQAATANFAIAGGSFKSSGVITYGPDTQGTICYTATDCLSDPPSAFAITGITGTFSDSNLGISNAAITGLVPISPTAERDPVFDPLVPASLSYVDTPGGSLSYNNLFFPDGSPIDCDYPFFGTFVDVFGMAFTVDGGFTVNVWGDGKTPDKGLTYGVGVSDGLSIRDYQFDGVNGHASVPEPSTWAVMLIGVAGLGASLRRARRQLRVA
jgi:hypothetical protein